jgi:hypothetical protein
MRKKGNWLFVHTRAGAPAIFTKWLPKRAKGKMEGNPAALEWFLRSIDPTQAYHPWWESSAFGAGCFVEIP